MGKEKTVTTPSDAPRSGVDKKINAAWRTTNVIRMIKCAKALA